MEEKANGTMNPTAIAYHSGSENPQHDCLSQREVDLLLEGSKFTELGESGGGGGGGGDLLELLGQLEPTPISAQSGAVDPFEPTPIIPTQINASKNSSVRARGGKTPPSAPTPTPQQRLFPQSMRANNSNNNKIPISSPRLQNMLVAGHSPVLVPRGIPTNISIPISPGMAPVVPQGADMSSLNVNTAPHVGVQQTMANGMVTPPYSQQPHQVGDLRAYSGAMEKLCESMKRSAMSRNLVKQLSGRSLTRQGSNRSLQKQGSARDLTRQNSGRNLTRQGSGRNLTRQGSGRNLNALARQASGRSLMQKQLSNKSLQDADSDTSLTSSVPLRRPSTDTKHRITRDAIAGVGTVPGRGIFRHKSSSALLGVKKQSTSLQLDDSALGVFHSSPVRTRNFVAS